MLKSIENRALFLWSNKFLIPLAKLFIFGSVFLTLVFNDTNTLFHARIDISGQPPQCYGIKNASIFCNINLEIARIISIFILLWAVSGLFPRYSCIPTAYITWSLSTSISVLEGGDQVASNLSILLVPLSIADRRKNIWIEEAKINKIDKNIASITFINISLQAIIIYFDASMSKIKRPEWADGSAMYYWTRDTTLGQGGSIDILLKYITYFPLGTVMLTWGTILLELLLVVATVASQKFRHFIAYVGIIFHLCILAYFGLFTFSLIMIGLIITYLLYDKRFGKFHAKRSHI
ncbi:MAG: HTTM domain-containing protein [Rothia sp. (in: high G+C Gram-positive bacteria)]|uniref:sporulation-delaying protein SdpB family protein n=1 Tax=Rothia sp. (in: high G+C Gram-positive bacteria) TaxID=1885016 RepID=UPI0026DF45EF|nr:sporulation-delaying protein SdpB family protein [Rothia sp. (in: high G+C Gram-positive bacteria)]MDO5750507.1 HTTM domain-containing protein [Rothia sp. (in: high G+C Gram-positive bacteria)]